MLAELDDNLWHATAEKVIVKSKHEILRIALNCHGQFKYD